MTTFLLVSFLMSVLVAGFWLWMVADFMNNPDIPSTYRMYWTAAFLFLNILTAIYYYFTVYAEKAE